MRWYLVETFLEYVTASAERKGKSPHQWLQEIVDKIDTCTIATHVGKFSHPETKVNVYVRPTQSTVGYVATDNVDCKADISVSSAAYLGTANFLLYPLEDNCSVMEHILHDDARLREEFNALHVDFDAVRVKVQQLYETKAIEGTDQNLKQVYFPVAPKTYHLLTVMPDSSVMIELTKRLQDTMNTFREQRKAQMPYMTMPSLVGIGFGGTKPQNISLRNSHQHGVSFLLSSIPPKIPLQSLRLPKRHFLYECIPYRQLLSILMEVYRIMERTENNKHVRDSREEVMGNFMDLILGYVYAIRHQGDGWSSSPQYDVLPKEEKILLDDAFIEFRRDESWLQTMSESIVRRFVEAYDKVPHSLMPHKKKLGYGERSYIRQYVRQVLKEEGRYRQ